MFKVRVRNYSSIEHLHNGREEDYGEIVTEIDFPTFQDCLLFVGELQVPQMDLRVSDELYTYRFHDVTDYGILLVVDSRY